MLVSVVYKQIVNPIFRLLKNFEPLSMRRFRVLQVEKGGEDAFFVSSHGGGVIAVADGVSG